MKDAPDIERWQIPPDPNQAEHDTVDQQRRDAEAEAQRNMTDATVETEGETDVRQDPT